MSYLRAAYLYFDQAIRDGSIRRAAENLNVASSAVNRQLLMLEDEAGVPLFERLPRGIRPTAAGEILLGYVRRWRSEGLTLDRDMAALAGGVRGTIRIAAAESITEDILPRSLAELQRRYPLVDYTVISGDNHKITSELFAKEADIVIAFDLQDHVRAEVLQAVTSPVGVICASDHSFAQRDSVSLTDVLNEPLIVPGQDWLQHSGLKPLFQSEGFRARIVAQAERPGMLKSMVAAGLGVAFLTHLGVEQNVSEGKLVWRPLSDRALKPAVISLMVPRHRVPPLCTMVFIDIVRRNLVAAARIKPPS
ncbi:MAG: LysR family transcriptional regulator [Pseudomonadota bacterium]|nr:LysR family transcriptional regulator [Pseudomonadota bacterium]